MKSHFLFIHYSYLYFLNVIEEAVENHSELFISIV